MPPTATAIGEQKPCRLTLRSSFLWLKRLSAGGVAICVGSLFGGNGRERTVRGGVIGGLGHRFFLADLARERGPDVEHEQQETGEIHRAARRDRKSTRLNSSH